MKRTRKYKATKTRPARELIGATVPADLVAQARQLAIDNDTTLSVVVIRALRKLLHQPGTPPPPQLP